MRVIFSLAMLAQLSNAASDAVPFHRAERFKKFYKMMRRSWEITPEENELFDAFIAQRSAEDTKGHELMQLFDKELKTQPPLAPATTQRPQFAIACELLVYTCNGVDQYAKCVWFWLERQLTGRTLLLYYTTNINGEKVVVHKHDPDTYFSNLRITDQDASDAINSDTNSNPTELKDDQKEEPVSTPHATSGGEATIFKHPKFLKVQAKLNEFFAIETPMHKKQSASLLGLYQERMFCIGPDCFLIWKEKENGAWVERGRFDQNNIDWDHFDDGIVTRAGMGEKGFKVFALKGGNQKEYKFRCKKKSWRNEFAKRLDAVIRKYDSIRKAQTRRRLVSRPIKHLSQEITNRVNL